MAGIAEESGKLVIATKRSELEPLAELERRGGKRPFRTDPVDGEGIRELEARQRWASKRFTSRRQVWSTSLRWRHGWPAICSMTAPRSAPDSAWKPSSTRAGRIRSADQEIQARVVVNCAGLYSDLVAALAGVRSR